MRNKAAIFLSLLSVFSIDAAEYKITMLNSIDCNRDNEMVEIKLADVDGLANSQFVIFDDNNHEIPYQVTYDDKIIFPVSVCAGSNTVYHFREGTPLCVESVVSGRLVPERLDDIAWENDLCAYRAYGPALQETGEKAYGYDIWTKSVSYPIIDLRYDLHINHGKPYHEDHGNGMDVYAVGPTLGGGTAALIDSDDNIIYPYCYRDYEILDNGPLRFTFKLKYGYIVVDNDTVAEERIISLDRGSFLNKTMVRFTGLTSPKRLAPGIVIHKQNPDGYILDSGNAFMAYADRTQDSEAGNGTIFIGVASPESSNFIYKEKSVPEGDAIGHILAMSTYCDGEDFTYWWGAGWSKGFMPDMESWIRYLSLFHQINTHPLNVCIEVVK